MMADDACSLWFFRQPAGPVPNHVLSEVGPFSETPSKRRRV